jgi:hypothetical protein
METTYYWTISRLDTKPQEGNLIDVVVAVHWRRTGTSIVDDKTYSAETNGVYTCPTPSETDFTAYPDLTREQVVGWLDAGLDVPELDLNLDIQIENQINPPIINLPLPWIPSPTSTTTTTLTTINPFITTSTTTTILE